MMRVLVFILLCCSVYKTQGQVKIGEPAPAIETDSWVQNPFSLFTYKKNTVIVLDFWFTSCAPCLYTMPHLNDLAESYKNDNIIFMAITFEKAELVEKFLVKKKMYALVGTDTSYQTIKKFEVNAYPKTFLINDEGILLWGGYPTELTREMIDIALKKEYYPTVEEIELIPMSSTDIKANEYPIDIQVNNDMSLGSGLMSNDKEIGFQNKTLPEIFANLFGVSKKRIEVEDSINTYDIRFKIPRNIAANQIKPLMIEQICKKMDFTVYKEEKLLHGYTMLVANDSLFLAHAVDTTKSYRGISTSTYKSYWEGKGLTMGDVVIELENRYGIYVFNKTRLPGYFEFVLGNEFEKASRELFNHYGLALLPDKQKVYVYRLKKHSAEK